MEAIMLDTLNKAAQFIVGVGLFVYLVVKLAIGLYVGFTG